MQAIIGSSDARFEPDSDSLCYEVRGSGVERAMLNYLIDNGTDAN